jgi:hypothetical protein
MVIVVDASNEIGDTGTIDCRPVSNVFVGILVVEIDTELDIAV